MICCDMRRLWSIALLAAVVLALPSDSGQRIAHAEDDKSPDVVFVPTPHDVVAKMLEMAKVTKDDVVYDLGCGDGRIVVAAAKKYGAKGVGFDVDPQRIKESNENVKKAGVEKLVEIKKEDIFKQDLSKASVITLYLLPSLNTRLIPQFDKMKPGSRIVSHAYDMDGVTPEKTVTIESKADGARHTIYYYTIPLKKDKKEE
jgi:predicted RNA methylase